MRAIEGGRGPPYGRVQLGRAERAVPEIARIFKAQSGAEVADSSCGK